LTTLSQQFEEKKSAVISSLDQALKIVSGGDQEKKFERRKLCIFKNNDAQDWKKEADNFMFAE